MRTPSAESARTAQIGALWVCASLLWFLLMTFVIIGAKLLPATSNALLDFLRVDHYYALLLPLAIPVALVAVYLNWFLLKLFRHA